MSRSAKLERLSYQSAGGNVNLTGSPDYAARIVYVGDPGEGCSTDPYRQFKVGAVTGPQYNSVGLESGRNLLSSCPDKTVDLSIVRNIRVGGGRQLQLRLDAFNAFNTIVINNPRHDDQLCEPDESHDSELADPGRWFD